MISRRLVRQGYTPFTAQNGREALERLRAEPFDLVLLDILMPEMNGYQVLEQLKARSRAAPSPRDHDLRPGRDRERGALHRDRGRGLPAQALQPGRPARAHRGQPGEEAAARPGGAVPQPDRGGEEALGRAPARHPASRHRQGAQGQRRRRSAAPRGRGRALLRHRGLHAVLRLPPAGGDRGRPAAALRGLRGPLRRATRCTRSRPSAIRS